ncbi:sulfatase [Persicirhabdus sediminis]|uniref:Sulfatase n=1 Tax=Persicirhabdus sediminis TaxID=454144 RepID=A0A8J7MEG6_9BACT|nr:sulfatase [Persicirhabdus sediminis]MBK1791212.1 sulfatase [Persicirhabdus sediminis]
MKSLILTAATIISPMLIQPATAEQRPNILFISADDMNDWLGYTGKNPDVITPNIDKLASEGTVFLQAHCQNPICGPSRASIMTSMYSSTIDVMTQVSDDVVAKKANKMGSRLMHEYFRDHGYKTMAVGKIMHKHVPKGSVDMSGGRGDWGRLPNKNDSLNFKSRFTITDWGAYPESDEGMSDYKAAKWAIDRLQEDHDKPFLLMVGFIRPHVPWFVPKKWFDFYPDPEKLTLPPYSPNELDDVPEMSKKVNLYHGMPQTDWLIKEKQWPNMVQAYLASITFADHYVGEVLNALESSKYKDNTIVIFWSDHGYHLGEKGITQKHSLWERSSHVPLIIKAPNHKGGQKNTSPVGLIDMYPTLVELAGLPANDKLEGISLAPLMKKPAESVRKGITTTYSGNNHAVQTDRYRYIKYRDGSAELYDHNNDYKEWVNLANNPEYQKVVEELDQLIPVYTGDGHHQKH